MRKFDGVRLWPPDVLSIARCTFMGKVVFGLFLVVIGFCSCTSSDNENFDDSANWAMEKSREAVMSLCFHLYILWHWFCHRCFWRRRWRDSGWMWRHYMRVCRLGGWQLSPPPASPYLSVGWQRGSDIGYTRNPLSPIHCSSSNPISSHLHLVDPVVPVVGVSAWKTILGLAS